MGCSIGSLAEIVLQSFVKRLRLFSLKDFLK